MSQLSQHRQRAQPPTSVSNNARPGPLSSHPPELIRAYSREELTRQQQHYHHHHHQDQHQHQQPRQQQVQEAPAEWTRPSWSSLPFAGAMSVRKHPHHPSSSSNFSSTTPDLSKSSASPCSLESFSPDISSFALPYHLNNPSQLSFSINHSPTMSSSPLDQHRHDSFGSSLPVPKAAAAAAAVNHGRRRSISMQKLFSLSNLKSSFGASRTSLHSTCTFPPPPPSSSDRPASNSTTSSRGIKRAAQEEFAPAAHTSQQPPLRKRKSNSWFRRKSGIFTFDAQNDDGHMPHGPDAMMMDECLDVRPTTEPMHSTSTRNTPASLLAPMSKTQTRSSQSSQAHQRPASSRTGSTQSRASSQNQYTYSPKAREAFSPPPTLPELTRIETSFGDSDMGELFAHFER
jgi:hypothetical protein